MRKSTPPIRAPSAPTRKCATEPPSDQHVQLKQERFVVCKFQSVKNVVTTYSVDVPELRMYHKILTAL